MAELTFEIEKQFGIRVDDEVLEVDTVQDLVEIHPSAPEPPGVDAFVAGNVAQVHLSAATSIETSIGV